MRTDERSVPLNAQTTCYAHTAVVSSFDFYCRFKLLRRVLQVYTPPHTGTRDLGTSSLPVRSVCGSLANCVQSYSYNTS